VGNSELVESKRKDASLKDKECPKKRGFYLFGSSGSGRTAFAIDMLPTKPLYLKAMNSPSDGYDYTSTIYDNYRNHLEE
jgi:hypothetical protein